MFLADNFASSPAGFVTGLGVPIVAVMIGFMWKRASDRIGGIESTLVETTRTLTVLLDHDGISRGDLVDIDKRTDKLEEVTAILKDRLDRHETWADGENKRIRDKT